MNEMVINDTWFAVEGQAQGNPFLVRGRRALHGLQATGLFGERIDLMWNLKEPTDNGIPTREEHELMTTIEDALTQDLERDVQSVLAIVETSDNLRTWMFFTRSSDEFMERLNQTLSRFDRLPITLETENDPDWKIYFDILDRFKISE